MPISPGGDIKKIPFIIAERRGSPKPELIIEFGL